MLPQKGIDQLKAELQKDLDGLYAGKTPEEIVEIINNPIKKIVQVEVPDIVEVPIPTKIIDQEITLVAPVFRVIDSVIGAPNFITEEDVIEAQL